MQIEVQQRILQHCKTLKLFLKLIKRQYVKYENDLVDFDLGTGMDCDYCLRNILGILKKIGLENKFGVHVLVDELDQINDNNISKIEEISNKFNQDVDAEVFDKMMQNLREDLLKTSFLKLKRNNRPKKTVYYITKKPLANIESFEVLERYFSTGKVLKDDENFLLFHENLSKMKADLSEKMPFSTIVGPSYLGKTQMAFTLANVVNVIYVNFVSISEKTAQPIYSLCAQMAELFRSIIISDMCDQIYVYKKRIMSGLEVKRPFRTLGLIYMIIKMRELSPDLDNLSWFKRLLSINEMIVPLMTCKEFISKTADLNLENHLVFIDEISGHYIDVKDYVKFVRNLCRSVKLPICLSSSNLLITELTTGEKFEESKISPWVQVTVKTPQSSLLSLSHLIQFKPFNSEITSSCLNDFIDQERKEILYDELFLNLYGSLDNVSVDPLKKLIGFLLKQAETCLPGLMALIFTKLFDLLPSFTNAKGIWRSLMDFVTRDVAKNKKFLKYFTGLLHSTSMMTFSSHQQFSFHKDPYKPNLVIQHLFRYGSVKDTTFRLDHHARIHRETEEKLLVLIRDEKEYKHMCYISDLDEDFFANFISYNAWNVSIINPEIETGTRNGTLASIYRYWLLCNELLLIGDRWKVYDVGSFRSLSIWSICHASHLNSNGETGGIELFSEFAKNLQDLNNRKGGYFHSVVLKGLSTLPEDLLNILNRIKVPFLIRFPDDETKRLLTEKDHKEYLEDFIKMGRIYTISQKHCWYILFDMNFDDMPCKGYIEFVTSLGISSLSQCYKRSCDENHPLSFVVCEKIEAFVNFKNSPISENESHFNVFNELWDDPENWINLYASFTFKNF